MERLAHSRRTSDCRLRIAVRGAVQGVGFRPYVYRLATRLRLAGWVNNSPQGVFIEVEGPRERLEEFLLRLEREKPGPAFIQSLESSFLDPAGFESFEIRRSESGGGKTAIMLPDLAVCPECVADFTNPANRRYRYPFTNCTNCGPRFSIITALPYDRPNTTMSRFVMCDRCRVEYENPLNRRFHAQPNACPECGPQLELWDADGVTVNCEDDALREAAAAIRDGAVVAVKGLGGFHLMASAESDRSVMVLRERKRRDEKPLAIMAPSLEWVEEHCKVSAMEARLLQSSESPIVLLKRRQGVDGISASVAPSNPNLGTMLPYTPLHHLLLAEVGGPVVATSGNLSDEPICTDEREALRRLAGIADLFLVHDRPIARHVDDSVVRVMMGREMVLRRARGYAPLPVALPESMADSRTILAVGAHLKSAVALSVGRQAFVSQHIGDLETAPALDAFTRVISDFERLYEAAPDVVACDLHPDYLSTEHAESTGLSIVRVQHHYAHVLSCMAENALAPPVLGVSWDGTGLGTDGTIWGGEFLRVDGSGFTRTAHFRTFPLPGGDRAVKEPRRSALGVLWELFGVDLAQRAADLPPLQAFSESERGVLIQMLEKTVNSPVTSSAGRLFDAAASIIGLRQTLAFEGQAAMQLEYLCDGCHTDSRYSFSIRTPSDGPMLMDWGLIIEQLIDDVRYRVPAGIVAARFQNALADSIVTVARLAGEERVVLAGGCFQNRYLTERAVKRLREEGFRPYWHQRVPPNDGGIALGQIAAAALAGRAEREKV